MPIHALPAPTVQQISSGQVLTDPSSVVKELIDNSLDACATAIFVEVAANCVDIISVRDNGFGIPPEDRALACRKHCTSKLTQLNDLGEIGGRYLGFRGEALASLAEMTRSLTITTRVDGESIALSLRVARDGAVVGQDPVSHPVGTTVKATDFFSGLPVRKQAALKHSAKYLAKIKRPMQAYALARATVRFSLKVLKAKTDKGNWIYAPTPGTGVEEAVLKVIGKDCASQCVWFASEMSGFNIQAFLPKADADAARIANHGQFIGIDSRPVSAARGTLKQIVALFKERFRKSNPSLSDIRGPFLYLNIICPPNSYDPNIEPAKDDVLFHDTKAILGAVEALFAAFYGEPTVGGHLIPSGVSTDKLEEATKPHASSGMVVPYEDGVNLNALTELSASGKRNWRSNMYGMDEEDLEIPFKVQSHDQIDEQDEAQQILRDASISNPWTLAKLNTTTKSKPNPSKNDCQLATPLKKHRSVEISIGTPDYPLGQRIELEPHALLTPQSSSPIRRQVSRVTYQQDEDVIHASHRDFWSPSSPQAGLPAIDTGFLAARPIPAKQNGGYVPASSLPLRTPLSQVPHVYKRPQHNTALRKGKAAIEQPFPLDRDSNASNNLRNVWFSQLSSQKNRAPPHNKPRNHEGRQPLSLTLAADAADSTTDHVPPARNRDIREFLGCIATKATTTSRAYGARPRIRPSQPCGVYEHSTRDAECGTDSSVATTTAQMDERMYGGPSSGAGAPNPRRPAASDKHLILPFAEQLCHSDTLPEPERSPESIGHHRRRTTNGCDLLYRSKSSHLPLELVPEDSSVQNISRRVGTSNASISVALQKLDTETNRVDWDLPTDGVYNAFAYSLTPSLIRAWNARLRILLRKVLPEGKMIDDLEAKLEAAVSRANTDDEEMLAI